MEKAKLRIEELVDLIIMHDKLYEENQPIITDSEYDALYLELMELETKFPQFAPRYSPTQNIYTKTVDSLAKSKHSVPMLSQDKATTLERIEEWRKQSSKSNLVIQHKMDGLTLVLTYTNGQLTKAVTRGNGEIGEDVTHNAMVITNIPKLIDYKDVLEVRGEVVVPFAEFDRINTNGQYSNPRNLASGTIRQLDAKKSAKIKLQFFAFDVANKYAVPGLTTESEAYALLSSLNFEVAKTWSIPKENGAAIAQTLKEIEDTRRSLPFMIDGAVFKIEDFKTQEELGFTSKFPKWAIAFKFQSLDATTKLLSVDWQVGKSGQVTPVANFDQVDIDGVLISRATLHNYQNIKSKDIRIGDTIVVARANDVIPYIQQSIKGARSGQEIEIQKPSVCPACGEPLSESNRSGESPILRCRGNNCEPQVVGKIAHWCSRDAMNILSLGDQAVQDLFEHKIIASIYDLYEKVQEERQYISNEMARYGEKKVENMLAAIEASKTANLSNVLYGLSIDQVGLSTAKDIAKEFGSMTNILNLLIMDPVEFVKRLRSIDGVADSVTEEFMTFMGCWQNAEPTNLAQMNQNVWLILNLMSAGMTMLEPSMTKGDSLKGKTFVITGSLSKPRGDIQKEIESLGGKVSGSVSKKTDYLLLGEGEENSSKHQKAKELMIAIINEEEYKALTA